MQISETPLLATIWYWI